MKIIVRRKETEIEATTILADNEQQPENLADIQEDAQGTAHLFMIEHPEILEVTYSTKVSKPSKTEREATLIGKGNEN